MTQQIQTDASRKLKKEANFHTLCKKDSFIPSFITSANDSLLKTKYKLSVHLTEQEILSFNVFVQVSKYIDVKLTLTQSGLAATILGLLMNIPAVRYQTSPLSVLGDLETGLLHLKFNFFAADNRVTVSSIR